MATYLYETIRSDANETVEQFEIRQSMNDAPLTEHPETGQPIKRVIIGGYGLMGVKQQGANPAPQGGGGCGASCGCHPH